MNIRQLLYFVRIVEEGSFSRASQSLHIAQPALSQQLVNLEQELGVKLLNRSVRGVTPTAAGQAVLRQAHFILRQVENTKLIAQQTEQGVVGSVTAALPWTISSSVGLALLRELRTSEPGIQIEIVEGPSSFLSNLLARGKADIAVAFDDSTDGGLSMNRLATEPLFWVGPKGALPDVETVDASRPLNQPLLLLSRPNGVRETLERVWGGYNISPHVIAQVNSPELLLRAVRDGLGHSILPFSAIHPAVEAGEVDAIRIDDERMVRHVYLCTSKLEPLSPAAERTYDILEKHIRRVFSTESNGLQASG